MEKLYVVYALESSITVVKANSKEEALDVFADTQVNNEILEEIISRFSLSDGLYQDFFRDEKGCLYDYGVDDLAKRVKDMEDEDEYIQSCIEKNVKDYWKNEPHFATEYLKELAKAHAHVPSDEFYNPAFSDGLKANALKKFIKEEEWYEHFDIVEINLKEKNHQLIYQD